MMSAYVSYGYGYIQGMRFASATRFPWAGDPLPEPCPENADKTEWLNGYASGISAS